ncbi:MAG: sodium-dependent transporter [Helicobacter sp.]|nr:sodium-dependent transporter [Helicobacter sp.]
MKTTSNFSKLGFILASLGSAIGLGHIWRFPYMAGENGGGAFVLLFLVLAVSIGVSLLIGEMIIGNKGRGSVATSFKTLDPTKAKKWSFVSLFVITGPFILTFYSVVLGWVLYYLVVVSFNLPPSVEQSGSTFTDLISNSIALQTLCLFLVVFATAYFVIRGVKSGIEKLNYVLMPLLFIIFIGLFFYAMSFDSFINSLKYMFVPDFSKITPKTLIDALGQMLFSLSLGTCTIISYASDTDKNQNLFSSALWIVIPGIFISLVAGIVIFTFVFEFSGNASSGPGLVFVTLPLIFHEMGTVGHLVSFLFMIGLLFAGITSTVSILEPTVKICEDKFKLSRAKGSIYISIAIFIVGFLVILSMDKNAGSYLTFAKKTLFDWIDLIAANYFLVFGALFSCIFVGWVIKIKQLKNYTSSFFGSALFGIWIFLYRFVAPIVILAILIYKVIIGA